jgi:hypothetical protein
MQNIGNANMQNIQNYTARFYAELCRGEKYEQEDM